MSADPINHEELALSRVATQYQAAQKFLDFLRALMVQTQEIEGVLAQVATISDIDVSEGVQLDNIGEIVGFSRNIKNSIPIAFFGFFGQPAATPFGEEGNASIGARFREEGESSTSSATLSDAQYRLFLRARIARNHSTGTIESITAALQFIFSGVPVIITDNNDMSFDIAVGKILDFTEQTLLYLTDIIPKPAGVRIRTRTHFDQANVFGFEGYAYALGFGDENQRHEVPGEPLFLDGTFLLDGEQTLDGSFTKIVYDSPLIGGPFAEEFTITI